MDDSIKYLQTSSENYGIVTISTPFFIPGTLAMIYSFLKYNTWYKGDFIILVEKIYPELQKAFAKIPNLKFQTVSGELLKRSTQVANEDKTGRVFKSHFFSLEIFNLPGYQKLLYIDSDMIVLGDMSELFLLKNQMICVGDSFYYKDQLRDGPSYNRVKEWNNDQSQNYWDKGFNAGLILFDRSIIGTETYGEIIKMVKSQGYSKEAMRLQDQMIQNIFFRGKYTLVSSKYNYRLGISKQIFKKDKIQLKDAIIIHYTARKKPWLLRESIKSLINNPKYRMPYILWQKEWIEYKTKSIFKQSAFQF